MEVSVEEAARRARVTALRVLAQIEDAVGLDQVVELMQVTGIDVALRTARFFDDLVGPRAEPIRLHQSVSVVRTTQTRNFMRIRKRAAVQQPDVAQLAARLPGCAAL